MQIATACSVLFLSLKEFYATWTGKKINISFFHSSAERNKSMWVWEVTCSRNHWLIACYRLSTGTQQSETPTGICHWKKRRRIVPPSGSAWERSGWNHSCGEILQRSGELSFMRDIILLVCSFIVFATRTETTGQRIPQVVYHSIQCDSNRFSKKKAPKNPRLSKFWTNDVDFTSVLMQETYFLCSVCSLWFQLWLRTNNPSAARPDAARPLLSGMLPPAGSHLCVTSWWVGAVTWLRVKRAPLPCTAVLCRTKRYVGSKRCVVNVSFPVRKDCGINAFLTSLRKKVKTPFPLMRCASPGGLMTF